MGLGDELRGEIEFGKAMEYARQQADRDARQRKYEEEGEAMADRVIPTLPGEIKKLHAEGKQVGFLPS